MGIIKQTLIKYKETTDKHDDHTYGEAYDLLFANRLMDENNILEIGIYNGGSIQTWLECFPNSHVYGVDITLENLKHNFDDCERCTIIESDIKKVELEKDFDIIIDDGSHYLEDVSKTFDLFYPKLKVGGIYVIEDVQEPDSWMADIRNRANGGCNIYPMDLRYNHNTFVNGGQVNENGDYNFYDNYLIIIEKHENG